MARGQRKSIDEKIEVQQHMINHLEEKLKLAQNELEALIGQKKAQDIETLYDYLKEANLGVYEAIEVLQQYMSGQYKATA